MKILNVCRDSNNQRIFFWWERFIHLCSSSMSLFLHKGRPLKINILGARDIIIMLCATKIMIFHHS